MDSFLYTCEYILLNQHQEEFELSNSLIQKISPNYEYFNFLHLLLYSRKNIHRDNQYLLRQACRIGNVELVKLFLRYGAEIPTGEGTEMIEISMKGHVELLKYFIELGVNIHEFDEIYLRCAISSGNLEFVKILLDSGANIHILDDKPFMNAILSGKISSVKLLIQYGANLSAQNYKGLWYALQKGIPEIVQCLLNYGCPTNIIYSPETYLSSPESVIYCYKSMLVYLPINPRKRWLL